MITPKGRVSCKVAKGLTFKRMMLMEHIARLEFQLLPISMIADSLGVSPVRIGQIKRSADYLRVRAALKTGVVSQLDQSLLLSEENRGQYFRALMPAALRTIAEILVSNPTSTQAKATQAKVAFEFLDREGTFAKVSRSEVKAQVTHDYSANDEVSKRIRDAVGGMIEGGDSTHIIHASEKSSALTPQQQEEALSMLESLKPEVETIQ